ncbi:MAG: DHA2 family efflux MFS transporter permease subunit [Chloroflexi bacterium]|nr:DHA2 family efflux MFS transporter permease subunit [Chloroflexota bacterium]
MIQAKQLALQANYKWWVFGATSVGMFVSVMDQSGMNIVVPSIAATFHATIPAVQWVVLGYILAISALMLPMGRLGDMVGRKKVYTIGFLVFAAGGALAALSPSLGLVIAMKMVQGAGAAMTQATSMAIVTSIFPPQERGKAIGLMTTIVGTGAIAGPIVGGGVVEALGWRAALFLVAPFGVLSALAGMIVLTPGVDAASGPRASLRSFDYLGAALSTAALVVFLLVMSFGYRIGWTSPLVIGGGVAVATLLAAFLLWERRPSQPLVSLDLFKRTAFTLGIASATLAFMAVTAIFFLMPFFLQQVQGYSPGQSGLVLVAAAACMATIGPVAGRLSDRFGTKPFTILGLALMTTALLLFSRMTESTPLIVVVLLLMLNGTGMANFLSPNSSAVLGSVERGQYGVASAFLNLVRNAGNITGLAIGTTVVAATMAARGFEPSLAAVTEGSGEGAKAAFAQGLSYACLLSAGMSAVALALAVITPRR